MQMTQNVSVPSANRWVPYDDKIEQIMLGDFKRLWATNFLDDLAVETHDYKFSNGVIGKIVLYNMEERQRVKIVDYVGSKKVEQSKIDEELKKQNLRIRARLVHRPGPDPQGRRRRPRAVRREGLRVRRGEARGQAGQHAAPRRSTSPSTSPKGPKVKIRAVDFQGNKAIGDGKLSGKMKENKAPNRWFGFITGGGTYKEGKFEDDADLVQAYYRERGYVQGADRPAAS